MGQRVIAPELQALYDKGAQVYSYSKLGTIHDCPYNAYLTYVDTEKREQCQNVYSYLGGICHDVLEGIIEGKNTEADIGPAIENGLDELEALKAITKYPSEILGIQDKKGDIKKGLDADLVFWTDHPFSNTTKVKNVFARGKQLV